MSVGTDGPRKIWNFHAVEWLNQPFPVYFSEKFQQKNQKFDKFLENFFDFQGWIFQVF